MDLIERGLHQAANIVLHLQHCRCSCDTRAIAPRSLLARLSASRIASRAYAPSARLCRAGAKTFSASQASADCDWRTIRYRKSLLARALAPRLYPLPGAVVLRSDVERKALFAAAETDKLLAAYTADITAKVYVSLAKRRSARCRPAIRSSWMPCLRNLMNVPRSRKSPPLHSMGSF